MQIHPLARAFLFSASKVADIVSLHRFSAVQKSPVRGQHAYQKSPVSVPLGFLPEYNSETLPQSHEFPAKSSASPAVTPEQMVLMLWLAVGESFPAMQLLPAAVQTLRSDPILIPVLILYAPLADSQGLPDGFPPASMLPWFPRCHNDIASGKSSAAAVEILLPALPLRRTGQMALSSAAMSVAASAWKQLAVSSSPVHYGETESHKSDRFPAVHFSPQKTNCLPHFSRW